MDRTSLKQSPQSISIAGVPYGCEALAPPGAALKKLAAATAFALLLLPAAQAARAQSIGDLDVRSRLGERFYGAVPVQMTSGFLDPNCIRVVPNPNAPQGAEPLQGARVRVGSADSVIIETGGAVHSPIVGLRLEVGCERRVVRDYVVLGEGGAIAGLTDGPVQSAARAPAAPPRAASIRSTGRTAPRARAASQTPRRQTAGAPVEVPTAMSPGVPASRQPITVAPSPPPAPAAAPSVPAPVASTLAPAASSVDASDAARRVAELRARSDDYAAALLALDDRLALLQKQAELLKLQLESAVATSQSATPVANESTASTPSTAPASAPVAVAPTTAQVAPTALPADDASRRREPDALDLLSDWGVAGGLAALLLGAFVLRRRHRPVFKSGSASIGTAADDSLLDPGLPGIRTPRASFRPETTQKMRAAAETKAADWHLTTAPMKADQTAEWVAPPPTDTMPTAKASAAGDALPGTGTTRELYITQQFQPTTERVVALASPEEIVQQARTHYMDDGDVFRAIDLLEMAVSARKDSPRPWQALLAIYHREHMTERFQRLATAYRSAFGEDDSWPTIRALGQAIDPLNPLYGGDTPPLPADLTERWLGVPLDFTAHLLANEIHDQLTSTSPGLVRRKRTAQE